MSTNEPQVCFTKEMQKDYTILIPNMAPLHFELLRALFNAYGYHVARRSLTPD